MLVLSRLVGEKILIGDDVVVVVVAMREGKVKIGIDAPRDIVVDREEVGRARKRHPGGKP